MFRLIHGEKVNGVDIDPQTRCVHYHSDLDIIAIKFKCCGDWYPCIDCHTTVAGHEADTWKATERDAVTVLCGHCGRQLTTNEYTNCDSTCPACSSGFNPGCLRHLHLYFNVG
ncbi:CHY zinc finger protein [soil metagenome]